MKIIALSDTHSEPLPRALTEDLKTADLIVHAGDFSDVQVYDQLKAFKQVRAVYGNMDGRDLRQLLPKDSVFECAGVKIGLSHGEGRPEGIIAKLREFFKDKGVQVVIFGHSHAPCHEMIDGVLYFNPGSPTDTVRAPYLSYGVIEINDGRVKARIVRIK